MAQMLLKEFQKTGTPEITLRDPDPNSRAGVINELHRATWLRLHGLLDGMLLQASNELFKEIRGNVDGDWLTRNFNSMRALMVLKESLVDDFRNLMSTSWQQFDQSVIQSPTQIPNETAMVIHAYAQRIQVDNQVLLRDLDQKLRIFSNANVVPHPLKPDHLLRVFWRSTECLNIKATERMVVLNLFDQAVLAEAALVWKSALDLLTTLTIDAND